MTVGQRSYEDGCPPGGYDPQARLRVMDDEQIDIVLLYPTIGIAWEGLVRDPQLATAYCRAYNRWIVDFCSADRRRLVPIAHICLMDPEGAVEEVRRARKDGCAGVYLSPDPAVARRPAVRRPEPGAVLGDGAGPRHADRLPRRRAHRHACSRRGTADTTIADRPGRLRLRVPRPRRDGRLHLDDDARPVRDLSAPAPRRARGGLQLDHRLARPPGPQVRGACARSRR